MDEQIPIKELLMVAAAAILFLAGSVVWLAVRFSQASAAMIEMIKASTDATRGLTSGVERIEALVKRLRTEQGK